MDRVYVNSLSMKNAINSMRKSHLILQIVIIKTSNIKVGYKGYIRELGIQIHHVYHHPVCIASIKQTLNDAMEGEWRVNITMQYYERD